jgi:hypothetical protein
LNSSRSRARGVGFARLVRPGARQRGNASRTSPPRFRNARDPLEQLMRWPIVDELEPAS